MNKELSVVIVHHNTPDLLKRCLASIYSGAKDLLFEVIVVDNASESLGSINEDFPLAKVILNKKNLGFAKANNQGIAASEGEYVLFLNPDTEVGIDSLKKMLNFMKLNRDIGILGPKLVFPDGSLQLSCRKFYTVRSILTRRIPFLKAVLGLKAEEDHLMVHNNHKVIMNVDWLLGACMMTKRDILIKLGGFDESYPLYFEDVDLCYRVKKTGLRVVYNPDFTIVHHHRRESAKSFTSKTIRHILSAVRFSIKYGLPF